MRSFNSPSRYNLPSSKLTAIICPGPRRPFSNIVVSGKTTMPVSEPITSKLSDVRLYRKGRSALRSTPATAHWPSVIAKAAGPSHGSMTLAIYSYIARWVAGKLGFDCHASGISISLAVGASFPERTKVSNTASNAAVSDDPAGMTGLISSDCAPKAMLAILISWLFIQFWLPRMVLISPLCARPRKGCANHHCGKVLVE